MQKDPVVVKERFHLHFLFHVRDHKFWVLADDLKRSGHSGDGGLKAIFVGEQQVLFLVVEDWFIEKGSKLINCVAVGFGDDVFQGGDVEG